jgi:hypothetical protein
MSVVYWLGRSQSYDRPGILPPPAALQGPYVAAFRPGFQSARRDNGRLRFSRRLYAAFMRRASIPNRFLIRIGLSASTVTNDRETLRCLMF